MPERITFQTTDGITIVGDYNPGAKQFNSEANLFKIPKLSFLRLSGREKLSFGSEQSFASAQSALLLHMMPADRTSWKPLSEKLAAVGISCLAIDLRGHGESVEAKQFNPDAKLLAPRAVERSLASARSGLASTPSILNYTTFTDAQHQSSRLDVDAALAWLASKGYDTSRVIIIGASIGANLALDAAARNPQINKVVMLSGGLDFRGVKTEPAAQKLADGQKVFLVASADDDYSFESHRTLAKIFGARATIKEFTDAGHGTTMFVHEPELLNDIVQWIQ